MKHAVILAGGSGTRLWPLSHRAMPKQLLPLGPGGVTLLSAAAARVQALTATQPLVVTNQAFAAATQLAVPGARIIAEPSARNTAPALAVAASVIGAQDPDALLVALPADQHIANDAAFRACLQAAFDHVAQTDDICTLGIVPTRPETGYGYLELASRAVVGQPAALRRFVEKPPYDVAVAYCASGQHLWNAGIFVASAKRILREIDTHAPEIGRRVAALTTATPDELATCYATMPSVSFDYAVMEKASQLATVPTDAGWDDIGAWNSLTALLANDAHGNAVAGELVAVDARHNVVSTDAGLVALVGVQDLVVVRRGECVLVMPTSRAQDVRLVVEALAASDRSRYL